MRRYHQRRRIGSANQEAAGSAAVHGVGNGEAGPVAASRIVVAAQPPDSRARRTRCSASALQPIAQWQIAGTALIEVAAQGSEFVEPEQPRLIDQLVRERAKPAGIEHLAGKRVELRVECCQMGVEPLG
jgi:hypothetical protein